MTIYLSGQMRNLPNHGADIFAEYAAKWRAEGHRVINPAELDARMPPYHSGSYREYMTRDIELILEKADAIFMLPNWINSPGAITERIVAENCGIPVYDADNGNRLNDRMEIWVHHGPNNRMTKSLNHRGVENGGS